MTKTLDTNIVGTKKLATIMHGVSCQISVKGIDFLSFIYPKFV